jgi:hypothetical protein
MWTHHVDALCSLRVLEPPAAAFWFRNMPSPTTRISEGQLHLMLFADLLSSVGVRILTGEVCWRREAHDARLNQPVFSIGEVMSLTAAGEVGLISVTSC